MGWFGRDKAVEADYPGRKSIFEIACEVYGPDYAVAALRRKGLYDEIPRAEKELTAHELNRAKWVESLAILSLSRKDSLMVKEARFVVGAGELCSPEHFDDRLRAVNRAEELARLNPGTEFAVHRKIGHAKCHTPTIWTDYE